MDRDTIRLILVLVGVLIMAAIYLWGRFKDPLAASGHRPRERSDEDPLFPGGESFEETVKLLSPQDPSRREPLFSGLDRDVEDHEVETDRSEALPEDPPPSYEEVRGAPFLIQVSVIAGSGRRFQGAELKQALLDNDLLYGDMGIFHRYTEDLTQTLFSVASLVEPGSFPIDDMNNFECPGIVLFFQTARVADPLATYDDLVNTSRELAHQLHGIQWDEQREPLSASKIAHMRNLLKHPPRD